MRSDEKKLLGFFRALPEAQRLALTEYAEFLASRHPPERPPAAVQPIPRPAEESVIKAVKRLRATYPMLDPDKLLNETSASMMAHVLHGQPAHEVIDRLEAFFSDQYRLFLEKTGKEALPPPAEG